MTAIATLLLNKYTAIIAATVSTILGGWLWHSHLENAALKASHDAGYSQRQAEDDAAMALVVAANLKDQVAKAKESQEIIDDLKSNLAGREADLADSRAEFASLRVLKPAAASSSHSGAALSSGPSAGKPGAELSNAGSQLPSLGIAGDELSKCDQQTDAYNALKAWVLARHPVTP